MESFTYKSNSLNKNIFYIQLRGHCTLFTSYLKYIFTCFSKCTPGFPSRCRKPSNFHSIIPTIAPWLRHCH